jgi:hypothetical protein
MEKREKAIGYGYIIADVDGRVQLHTLRSNRTECWKEFAIVKDRAMKMGFRAVPVWIEEHEPKADAAGD